MMGTQRLNKSPVTNDALDLWRQYQEALCDGEDSPEAKRLDFEIWRRLDLVLASITWTRTLCTCALVRIRRHDQLD
jgi:hypothetical protein